VFSAAHNCGAVSQCLLPRHNFPVRVLPWHKIDSFTGDYYGQRCHSGKKSSDIFNDYIDLLDNVLPYDDSEINWQLNNDATAEEFESWEHHML
jgi:hypothetical protein